MGTTYHCTNNNCNFPGNDQFKMTFDTETIIDTNNIATIFCPFCKKPMLTTESINSRNGSDTDGIQLSS